MPFVLDASVTMTWCFSDEAAPETDDLLQQLAILGAVVPALWHFEVANILATAIRRKRISADEARAFLKKLDSLTIVVEQRARPITGSDLLPLVLQYGLTAYDAAYLELAKRSNFAIATLDRQLIAAAQQEGVFLMLPIR
jgi:predicted nucleic acid-binding protein